MKHFVKSLVLSSALLLSLAAPVGTALAAPLKEIGYKVQVNEELVHFPDTQPFVDSANMLQAPVRFISDKLGYEAHWENAGSELKITLKNKENTFSFTTGSSTADINGKSVTLQTVPQNIDGRAFFPVRSLADILGIPMQWDAGNQIAIFGLDGKYHAPAWYAPKIEKVLEAKATAYTGSADENGNFGSVDYFGNPLKVGTIAVDPNVIPLGTKVYIEGYSYDGLPSGGMYATATDIGGAVKENKIDIFVPESKAQAQKFGIQQVKIFVLK